MLSPGAEAQPFGARIVVGGHFLRDLILKGLCSSSNFVLADLFPLLRLKLLTGALRSGIASSSAWLIQCSSRNLAESVAKARTVHSRILVRTESFQCSAMLRQAASIFPTSCKSQNLNSSRRDSYDLHVESPQLLLESPWLLQQHMPVLAAYSELQTCSVSDDDDLHPLASHCLCRLQNHPEVHHPSCASYVPCQPLRPYMPPCSAAALAPANKLHKNGAVLYPASLQHSVLPAVWMAPLGRSRNSLRKCCAILTHRPGSPQPVVLLVDASPDSSKQVQSCLWHAFSAA